VLDNIHEEFKTILAKYAIKVHSFQEAKGISGMKGFGSKVQHSSPQTPKELQKLIRNIGSR
jgi:hypothetical protein